MNSQIETRVLYFYGMHCYKKGHFQYSFDCHDKTCIHLIFNQPKLKILKGEENVAFFVVVVVVTVHWWCTSVQARIHF